ncbi:MAG: murein biosynthesis integral rane protein MurJ [Actinomycetota bacterium]
MSDVQDSGLLRNSAAMAIGTVASRVTGILRDIAMTAALGFFIVSDAYSLGNTLPNIIYILIAGGALNAVFIPQLVRHMKSDEDDGKAFADRLLTIVGLVLFILSVVSVIAAPWIVRIYTSSGLSNTEYELAVAFARLCLPQIFFYGAYTMLQQVLNARGKFAAAMFAPIANNLIAIIVFVGFIVVVAPTPETLQTLSSEQVWWLGLGTTLGVVLQALVLFPSLIKSGYVFRPRWDWKGSGLGHAGSLAIWTLGLVAVNQIAYAVITRLATSANVEAAMLGEVATGLTTYQKAHLIFILPHSVITVSLVTALLPQLSRLAHAGNFLDLGRDVSRAARMMLALIVPVAGLLIVTAPRITTLLFGYGAAGIDAARAAGVVVAMFAFGLPAYSLVYVLYRAWYAMEDTRSPFWLALILNVINLIVAVPLFSAAPVTSRISMLAVSYSVAYTITAAIAWWSLRSRIQSLETRKTLLVFIRLVIATAIGSTAAWLTYAIDFTSLIERFFLAGILINLILAWLVGFLAFVLAAHLLKIDEVSRGISMIRRRLGR